MAVMTPWHTLRFLAFDLETTGISVEDDRIVTAAAYRVGGGLPVDGIDWLIDPQIEIPTAATKIHKVTTERARAHGAPAVRGIEEIATVLVKALDEGLPIVGHNIGLYDLTLLDRECRRHLGGALEDILGRPVGPVIDSRTLDQHAVPKRRRTSDEYGPRTLRATAGWYRLEWDEEHAHGAEYDALQAARVAWWIGQIAHLPKEQRPEWSRGNRFDDLAGLSLEELHERQVGWAAQQCAELQSFLRQRDPAAVVDGSWPLRKAAPR